VIKRDRYLYISIVLGMGCTVEAVAENGHRGDGRGERMIRERDTDRGKKREREDPKRAPPFIMSASCNTVGAAMHGKATVY
jgi:hypothetical protein